MKRFILLSIAAIIPLVLVFSHPGATNPDPNGTKDSVTGSAGKRDGSIMIPGFKTLEEAADSNAWAKFFPNQFQYWKATEEMILTTYGGGGRSEAEGMEIEKIDYLELYPFLKINYTGFPFEKGYYRSRGHIYALTDVVDTRRLPDWDKRPASCLSCKSTDVVVLMDKHGEDLYRKPFSRVVGKNTVGCLDCHSHEDASLKVQRPWVTAALEHGSFKNIEPEGRTDLTCAQCHVNYYFDANTRKPVMPWSVGLTVEDQLEDYSKARRSDEWEHAVTGALVAKIQHPEYELFHEGQNQGIHSSIGLGCIDCHMPVMKDERGKLYTSHTWRSPLAHVEESCLQCHADWGKEDAVGNTEAVQAGVYEKQNRIGAELADYIVLLGEKIKKGELSEKSLDQARAIHREAQFYWDFIWVENSNGFHNWEEAHRVLDNAERLIRKGMELIGNT